MSRLTGRAAVITGAGDGIGRGLARRFALEGAAVLIAEINEANGRAAAEELETLGARAHFHRCDVTRKSDVEGAIAACAECFGSIDILVNNAYRGRGLARLEAMEDAWFEESFAVNFWAAKWSMMAAFAHMRAKGWGRIINFCSLNGVNAHIGTADYNVGKEALRTLTRAHRQRLPDSPTRGDRGDRRVVGVPSGRRALLWGCHDQCAGFLR